ncbi:MAG: hypothetical protein ABIQ57_01425, partial [Candidatus Kapaibacterium sp.]
GGYVDVSYVNILDEITFVPRPEPTAAGDKTSTEMPRKGSDSSPIRAIGMDHDTGRQPCWNLHKRCKFT